MKIKKYISVIHVRGQLNNMPEKSLIANVSQSVAGEFHVTRSDAS